MDKNKWRTLMRVGRTQFHSSMSLSELGDRAGCFISSKIWRFPLWLPWCLWWVTIPAESLPLCWYYWRYAGYYINWPVSKSTSLNSAFPPTMTISVVTLLFVIGGTACQTMAIKVAVSAQVSQMIEATSLFLSKKGIFPFKIIHPPLLVTTVA